MTNRVRLEELRKDMKYLKEEANGSDSSMKQYALDVGKPKCRKTLRGHLSKVSALHWSTNPANLVSAAQDGYLLVWDALTANRLHAIPLRTNSMWVMTCAYSPSNSFVASAGLDNMCSIFNLNSPEQPCKACRELTGHTAAITCCRFVSDSQILTTSGDKTCKLYDIESGKVIKQFADHDRDVLCLAISPLDPNTVITGSCDGSTKIWDTRTTTCSQAWEFDSDVNAVSFLRNGLGFGLGCEDSVAHFVDMRKNKELMIYCSENITSGITSIDFSISGRFLFGGYDAGVCHVWDTLLGVKIWTLEGHEGRIASVGVNSDGSGLATGAFDSLVKIWA